MKSIDLKNILNKGLLSVKITGAVTTGNSKDTLYYVKPSFRCKVLGAKLYVVTASGANLGSKALITKETAVTDTDLPLDTVTISTNITAGTVVDNDDILNFAVADVAGAKTTKIATPGANHAGTENDFDPDDNDAILILFPATSNATLMVATLELELQPL
jgi:hypothetical protein